MLNINGKEVVVWGNLVTGNEDYDTLKKCLDSVTPCVDVMLIGFNGSEDNYTLKQLFGTYPNVQYFAQKWEGDITKCRKEVYNKTPDDALVLWMDSDDTIINTENIKQFSEEVFSHKEVNGWACEWYYAHDLNGNCVGKLYRERMVWKSRHEWTSDKIHQVLEPNQDGITVVNEEIKIRHLATIEKIRWSAIRNVNIIQKEYDDAVKAGNLKPKTIYDLARSLQGVQNYDRALKLYQDYIDHKDNIDLERAIAYTMMGYLYRARKDWVKAKEVAFKVISLNPDLPDGYLDFGESLYGEGRIREAVAFIEIGFKFPPCKQFPIDPTKYTYNPLKLLAYAYFDLGQIDKAQACAERVLSAFKNNIAMLDVIRECKAIRKEIRVMDNIIEIKEMVDYDPAKVKALVAGLPEFAHRHPTIKKEVEC